MENTDESICRTCMGHSVDPASIYEIAEKHEKSFAEMLGELTKYKIGINDILPKKICKSCVIDAQNAFAFKEKAEESYRTLKQLLGKESANANNQDLDKSTETETDKTPKNFLSLPQNKSFDIFKSSKGKCKSNQHKNLGGTTCPICNRAFSRKDHTKEHILKIHKEDPYKYFESRRACMVRNLECSICCRKFNRKQHLTRHIMLVHKQDPKSVSMQMNQTENKINDEDTLCDNSELLFEKSTIGSDFEAGNDLVSVPVETNIDALIKNEPKDGIEDCRTFVKVEEIEKDCYEYEGDCFDEPAISPQREDTKSPNSTDNDSEPLIKMKNLIIRRRYGSGEATPEERTCQFCKRIFSRLSHLRRHIQSSHTQEKPHACPHCDKKFSRSDRLKNHIQGVHAEKTHKCDVCEKAFTRKEALQRHKQRTHGVNTSTNFNCELCERTFSQKHFLARHQLMHSDRIFACRYCEETFKDRKLLKEHERTHNSNKKDFLCSICGESFGRIDYLRIHVQRHLGEKPHKCQYCEKCFIRKSDLKEHERYHTNTKPNICKICDKGFVRRSKLTIHMRTHSGEKPYVCTYCPESCRKSFAQRNDLKAHVRRHTGERFRCDQCDAAFLQLYGLRQHALNTHGTLIESSTGRLEKIVTA